MSDRVCLGDGLYARDIGGTIKLEVRRETEIHIVYLEPEVLEKLLQFAVRIGWLKNMKNNSISQIKQQTARPNLDGLTERDYFAAAALTGIISNGGEWTTASHLAYRAADIMLEERTK